MGPIFVFRDNMRSECVSLWFSDFVKTPQCTILSSGSSNLGYVVQKMHILNLRLVTCFCGDPLFCKLENLYSASSIFFAGVLPPPSSLLPPHPSSPLPLPPPLPPSSPPPFSPPPSSTPCSPSTPVSSQPIYSNVLRVKGVKAVFSDQRHGPSCVDGGACGVGRSRSVHGAQLMHSVGIGGKQLFDHGP